MDRPNFLVFMTDHQRGDMQPPHKKIIAPNMERLYGAGVSFTNAFCPSPHCCPSRATFFSGLYPSEHGVWNNVDVSNALSRGLFDGVRLFSEDMAAAGYNMYYSGKWHVSALEGPEDRGFINIYPGPAKKREFLNAPDIGDWWVYGDEAALKTSVWKTAPPASDMNTPRADGEIKRRGYPKYTNYGVHEDLFNDRAVVDAALERLDKISTREPFFLYAGTSGPHDPYFAPQRFLDMYDINDIELPENFDDPMTDKPAMYRRIASSFRQMSAREHRDSLRHYYAFCTFQDYLFGLLLDKLESRGLLDSTVVLYCSDHGDYAGAHGLWAKGLPCFSEAYHVNALMGFGGTKPRGSAVSRFVSLADFAPTFLDLAGIPCGRKIFGRTLAPYLRGEEPADARTEMYTQTNGNEVYGIQRAVFDGDYKYVFNTFDFDELYDLKNDAHETKNLIDMPCMQPVVEKMCRKLWRFARDNNDNAVNSYIMTAFSPYGPGVIFE
ncbi:MAG: sulfatase-like hydrolase/transferase [Defluviitaleaceae bacterium]|nr:sulfatase-like hydrolase/transferase [Defluviitaleaceae bacterium]